MRIFSYHSQDSKPLLTIGTIKEFPDFKDSISELISKVWPKFYNDLMEKNQAGKLVHTEWSKYQVVCFDQSKKKLLGCGLVAPICFDGNLDKLPGGWDDALQQALDDYATMKDPTILSGISVTVDPEVQKQGISSAIINKIIDICRQNNFHSFIVALRPLLKHYYPLIPLEKYAHWTTPTGEPFDPWIRTHVRAGGKIAHVSPSSMLIKGTVDQWQKSTGLSFQSSGEYIVKGALAPITIDLENNIGIYREPNIWIIHTMSPNPTNSKTDQPML